MFVRDILAAKGRRVVSVAPERPIGEVVKVLHENEIGAVLVMDGRELLGVLSERGIVRAIAQRPDGVCGLSAASAMRRRECDIGLGAGIEEAMALMTRHRVRYLPVIEDGDLIGVISIGDVVKAELDRRGREVEVLTRYIAGR